MVQHRADGGVTYVMLEVLVIANEELHHLKWLRSRRSGRWLRRSRLLLLCADRFVVALLLCLSLLFLFLGRWLRRKQWGSLIRRVGRRRRRRLVSLCDGRQGNADEIYMQ